MRILKQEIYFPIIIGIHFIFWAIDLAMYQGSFMEHSSDTLLFGEMTNASWLNIHRILGEVFSSWVVTVFAFNFLMATRARWVERLFGGLDKMYMIHRRSGVIAVTLLLGHFLIVPRDLTAFSPGKPMGFYALILILLGVALSALPVFKKKIPYHKWLNIHKLMGLFYILGVMHGILVKSLIQELPITRVYVFGMAFIGIIAWFYRAFLFGLFNKKLSYTVNEINELNTDITELVLQPVAQKLQFLAGQFAFFSFDTFKKREQHPFTISSHPYKDHLRISVKHLGDFTNTFTKHLNIGDKVKVEGPYGLFSSSYNKEKDQIWIAGGIGITPFLSLAKDVYLHEICLYWTVKNKEEAVYLKELEHIAMNNPNFSFKLWESDKSGYLKIEDLQLDSFNDKSFLICGPNALKKSIMLQLKKNGVSNNDIHDEEFAFR